jgi:hypothetical protein
MIQYCLRIYSTYIACFLFYSKLEHSVTSIQPSGHYMYHQFNIQQLYVLSTQCIYVCLCGSENKQRLFPYTALTDWFYNRDGECLLRGTDWVFVCDSGKSWPLNG